MFIPALIIPLFFGVFYFNNEEFFDTAFKQHPWHYVDSTNADLNLPPLTLQVGEGHPFVIYLN